MLQKKKWNYLASSAIAVMSTVTVSNALADSGPSIVGLSSDGSSYLHGVMDQNTHDVTYYLTSSVTGQSVAIVPHAESYYMYAQDLSADGSTAVGSYYTVNQSFAYIWTAADGIVDLGSLGGKYGGAYAVSADGSAVTGYSSNSSHVNEAFHWTKDGGMEGLGSFAGSSGSDGLGISADGKTVVGEARRADGSYHAFAWSVGDTSITDIAQGTSYSSTSAKLVSDNGSVVAGSTYSGASHGAFRWTSAGMTDIGSLGGDTTNLTAMSGNGDILVGYAHTADEQWHAFRYIASESKMTDLKTLGGDSSRARDVTSDGTVIVGSSNDASSVNRGFRWTESTGMISIEDWLSAAGVSLGSDITETADFVSDDGSVVIGSTTEGTTYVARLASEEVESGIIDTAKYFPTVASANNIVVQGGVSNANTIMFGAQGSPMRNLLSIGQRSVWGTVDAGHDDGGSSDGNFVLGDFGFGYGIADGVTARFSAGGLHSDQDLDAGGSVRQKGFYLSPEVSADLGGDVFVTLGGYWGKSSIDSKRGYLNGATMDYSNGDTDADTWGAKIRFDWLNAFSINETAITPYVGLSYARTKVDGYTETGGSFPVSYDDTSDHATIARLGADFVHPLSDSFRLLAKAEAAYQFEDKTEGANGTIVGLDNFSLAGQDLKQFWVRGGLGGEFDVGGGTASLMVNVTTQGQDPDVWVRSNWTVKF